MTKSHPPGFRAREYAKVAASDGMTRALARSEAVFLRPPSRLVILLLAFAFGLAHSAARRERTVTGTALDVYCDPIPGVSIAVSNGDSVVTDARGRFSVTVSSADPTTFRGSLPGFHAVERALGDSSNDVRVFMLLAPVAEGPRTANPQTGTDSSRPPEARSFRGRVLDDVCRALTGARVRLLSANRSTATDRQGGFSFDSVALATSDVEITAPGFVRTIVRGVTVDAITVALDRGTFRDHTTVLPAEPLKGGGNSGSARGDHH